MLGSLKTNKQSGATIPNDQPVVRDSIFLTMGSRVLCSMSRTGGQPHARSVAFRHEKTNISILYPNDIESGHHQNERFHTKMNYGNKDICSKNMFGS